jgi:tetratricopeptide (TPR) repeat protein
MRRILLLIPLLFTAYITFAQPTELLEKANKEYIDNNYEEAIVLYEQIVNSGYSSAALYYNLGSAYYKLNDIANSILNFERAKQLAPGDDRIDHNLNIARLYVVDKIEVLPQFFLSRWIDNMRASNSSDGWAIWSIVLFALFVILGSVYFLASSSSVKKIMFFISIFVLLTSVISLKFSADQKDVIMEKSYGIVFAKSVTLKSSPDESGTNLFLLHEGTKVKVTDKVGDWVEIMVSDGNRGWLKSSDVEVI